MTSALRRLTRDGVIEEDTARLAESRLDELVRASQVIVDVEEVKVLARRLLRRHAVRAFDALQIGATVLWAEGHLLPVFVLDGVYTRPTPDAVPVFHPLPPPTDKEIGALLERVHALEARAIDIVMIDRVGKPRAGGYLTFVTGRSG